MTLVNRITSKSEAITERRDLLNDFNAWSNNGFSTIYDSDTDIICFPNGQKSSKISKLNNKNGKYNFVAVSENEVLFTYTYNESCKTDLVAMDWNFKNNRTLLSLDGDYTFYQKELFDRKICLGNDEKYVTFNPAIGVAVISNDKPDPNQCVDVGLFRYENGNYVAKIPNYMDISFSKDSINQELSDLLFDWNFFPARCRMMFNDTICCSFHRAASNDGGQDAVFLIKVNSVGEILNYQFSQVKSSKQNDNWAYDIYESFANQITIYDV